MTNDIRPWRSFTIFVSSTFIDMEAERDYLNNIVARELEREYEKKRVSLNFIDLRWGVQTNKDADKEIRELSVLHVCMEEIRRSRPFFIALLGHRYGWVPSQDRFYEMLQGMDEEDRQFLKDGENASVTALEILFGAIGDDSLLARSLFYFRDFASYANMSNDELSIYQDLQHADKLEQLKKRIISVCYQNNLDNVHSYCLEWYNGHFTGLEEWGEQVKCHLRREIDAELEKTMDSEPTTWLELEDLQQDIFYHSQTRLFIGRHDELAYLEHFAINEYGIIVLSGFETMGKSALLCQLYHRLHNVPGLLVLMHCTDVSQYANSTYRMFCRLSAHLCAELHQPYVEPNDINNEARNYFLDLVRKVSSLGQKKIVLLIDSTDNFRPSDDASNYSWLPDEACCILTCKRTSRDEYVNEIRLYKPHSRVIYIPFMSREDARILVRKQCLMSHKNIPEKVIELIINKKANQQQPLPEGYPEEYYACFNPLWVKLIVRLLISLDENDFAEARQIVELDEEVKLETFLCQCVQRAPIDPTIIIMQAFVPKIIQNGSTDLTFLCNVLSVIALSRGVSESDLSVMFDKNWDQLSFSKIHHYLKDVLVEDYETGKWNFSHRLIKEAFIDLFPNKELVTQCIHALGNYYCNIGKGSPNAARNAIYFLIKGNRKSVAAYHCSAYYIEENDVKEIVDEIVETIMSNEEEYIPWFISMFSQCKPDDPDLSMEMWSWMEVAGYQRLYTMAIMYLIPRLALIRKNVALQFAQGIEPVVKIYIDNHPHDSIISDLQRKLYGDMDCICEAICDMEQRKKYVKRLSDIQINSPYEIDLATVSQGYLALDEKDYTKAERLFMDILQRRKQRYASTSNDPRTAYDVFVGCMYLIDVYRYSENQEKLRDMVEEAFIYLPHIPIESKYQTIKGIFYHIAGSLYDDIGQDEQALALLKNSIKLLTTIHEENLQDSEITIYLGIAYEALGQYYNKRNQYKQALDCYYKQIALFNEVLGIDIENEKCLHFKLIATCHVWDILKSQSDKKDEWIRVNNDLVRLARSINPDLFTEHDLWRIGPAYFLLGRFWEEQAPEDRTISPESMLVILSEGWFTLKAVYFASHDQNYIEMGIYCLLSRLKIATENKLPQEEPFNTLMEAYKTFPPSDSEVGQLLRSQIKQLLSAQEKKQKNSFNQAFESGEYIEAITCYQEETTHTEQEQLVYALCLLRAEFRKKATDTFTKLRDKAQCNRNKWLLITLNLSVCYLLEGNLSAFKKLYEELTSEEKNMEQVTFLWNACIEVETIAYSNRPWYKRILGVQPSIKELCVTFPKPLGWIEL